MQHSYNRTLWRASFIDALQLVGEATARLPVGVPDPVLCGEAAIELYTGGLWATDDLELYVAQPRPLIAELFAMGFRWTRSPRCAGRSLWHSELQMGMKITGDHAPLGAAELANLLTIATDGERVDQNRASLKVIGIEDVIAEEVASWRTHRVTSAQATTRIQVLVALARRGIGGPFRGDYLQRRLAHDTGGEVAFETTWPGEGTAHDTAPRAMALSSMETVAKTWCVASGFTFERAPPHAPRRPRERSSRRNRYSNDEARREGGSGIVPARIIPVDGMQTVPFASMAGEHHPEGGG
jgi:hypothetical protein